jgi:hypothetical protein
MYVCMYVVGKAWGWGFYQNKGTAWSGARILVMVSHLRALASVKLLPPLIDLHWQTFQNKMSLLKNLNVRFIQLHQKGLES